MTATSETIAIRVNGKERAVDAAWSIKDLIADLGLADRPIAVERNHSVVPRAVHAETRLEAGDTVELVSFVGGG